MFASFPFSNLSRLLQCEEGWWFPDAALMSGWGGLWSMYVSRTERGVRREGGGLVWDHWSWVKHESRRPTLPISCLHFISILPCYFCSLKASDESLATDKCLCLLVFYGPQMIDFIRPPLSFIPLSFFLLHSRVCFEMPQEKLQPLVYITVP